jgi:hypothetical protein
MALASRIAHTTALDRIARYGLLTRAVLHAVIALLALQVAWGTRATTADKAGALETIAAQPFGRALLLAVAFGCAAYAVWRFVRAAVPSQAGGRAQAWVRRGGYVARGLLYGSIAFTTARLLAGTGGEDRFDEVDATARLMHLPLGRVLVALVGVGVVAAAVWSFRRAFTGEYREHLDLSRMDARQRRGATTAAVAGLVARGVVRALVGGFLLLAALRHDPRETVGLDGALRVVGAAPWGRLLLTALALGLLGYAVFGVVEAKFRRVAAS